MEEYRAAVNERLQKAELLINKLVHENSILEQEMRQQKEETALLTKQNNKLQQDIDELTIGKTNLSEEVEMLKDFFEHLCDVRVHRTYEDSDGLWFNVSQQGEEYDQNNEVKHIMDYKLGFIKGSKAETDVIYVPLLKERTAEELTSLQRVLPDYLFDTISFPLKSINQFYNKLSKCLNKK